MNRKRAILLAANPFEDDIFGNIHAHAMHLAKYGGVFWTMGYGGPFVSEEFKHKEIKSGYFYNTISHTIDYWFESAFIRAFPEIKDPELYEIFIPHWRRKYFNNKSSGYWILITNITPLTKQYSFKEFTKPDGTSVEAPPRSYTIVNDPYLPKLVYKII